MAGHEAVSGFQQFDGSREFTEPHEPQRLGPARSHFMDASQVAGIRSASFEVLDEGDCLGGVARVEGFANLVGPVLSEFTAEFGQENAGYARLFGLPQVAPSRHGLAKFHVFASPVHESPGDPFTQLASQAVIGEIWPPGQLERFFIALSPHGLFGLPQCESPLTKHGCHIVPANWALPSS
jgi:hypothetical protein